MLKRYAEADCIRWVGKGWEIKRSLNVLRQQKGGSTRLKELLPQKKEHAAH